LENIMFQWYNAKWVRFRQIQQLTCFWV
jgi:hypothetical protein